jgi:hypothetical protein
MNSEEKYTKENIKKKIIDIIGSMLTGLSKKSIIYQIFYKELGIFENAIEELKKEKIVEESFGFVDDNYGLGYEFTEEYFLKKHTNYNEKKERGEKNE